MTEPKYISSSDRVELWYPGLPCHPAGYKLLNRYPKKPLTKEEIIEKISSGEIKIGHPCGLGKLGLQQIKRWVGFQDPMKIVLSPEVSKLVREKVRSVNLSRLTAINPNPTTIDDLVNCLIFKALQ